MKGTRNVAVIGATLTALLALSHASAVRLEPFSSFTEVTVESTAADGPDLKALAAEDIETLQLEFEVSDLDARPNPPPFRRDQPVIGDFVVIALSGVGDELGTSFFADPHIMRQEEPSDSGTLSGNYFYLRKATTTFVVDGRARKLLIMRKTSEGLKPVDFMSLANPIPSQDEGATKPSSYVSTQNGPPTNRLDMVILAEGYTVTELERFTSDAEVFLSSFFAEEPFREYAKYFNVHLLPATSAQSGADHPERGEFRDTAFDSTYYCNSIQRLICVDIEKARSYVNQALPFDSRDLLLVLVNDQEYGGSGGSIAVSSVNEMAPEIVLHEVGHTLGRLDDEYVEPSLCTQYGFGFRSNTTPFPVRELVPWKAWIDPSTPVPTISSQPATPGAYPGTRYCPVGFYRPTFNSKMRSLGVPFEQVNTEQLVLRTYGHVSPIDSVDPSGYEYTIASGAHQTFSVTTPTPMTHDLRVSWFLDGQLLSSDVRIVTLDGSIGVGTHRLEVKVQDVTSLVRQDSILLTSVRGWTVQVEAP